MPSGVRLVLDGPGIAAELRGATGAEEKAVAAGALAVLAQAQRLCPVDNGVLRASLTWEVVSTASGPVAHVGSPLAYALYVHEGTGIYGPKGQPIRPTRGAALRWPNRGMTGSRRSKVPGRGRVRSRSLTATSYSFAKSVKGVRPRPFLKQALEAAAL